MAILSDIKDQMLKTEMEFEKLKHMIMSIEKQPACFGYFDETNPTCLECAEQDDCEIKMIIITRGAQKVAAQVTPASDASIITAEDLMAEMEAAISK